MKQQLLLFVLMLLPMVASADDSGSCGENVTWAFVESTKTLSISGSGEMDNYNNYNWPNSVVVPWNNYKDQIEKVIIDDGVSSIGDESFIGCGELNTITIPNSVVSVGNFSFEDCIKLHTIIIPNSVTSIGQGSFMGCTNLSSLEIPNNITSIGSSAFQGCTALATVIIPSSLSSISYLAFADCSNLSSITISQGVTVIGQSAFKNCSKLSKVIVPNSIITIGEDAFAGCEKLNSLVLEDGGETLRFVPRFTSTDNPKWFTNCPLDMIYIGRNVEYSYVTDNNQPRTFSPFREMKDLQTVVFGSSIRTIPDAMFWGCSHLQSVELSDGISEIGSGAFYECENLSSFTIPENVEEIQGNTFYGCKNLLSISIPKSVNIIHGYAFNGCLSLQSIIIEKGNTTLTFDNSIPENAFFAQCPVTHITLGRNINNYNSPFNEITTPFSLTIGQYVTELSHRIFMYNKITSLVIEDGTDAIIAKGYSDAYGSYLPFCYSTIESIYLGRIIKCENDAVNPFADVSSSFKLKIGPSIKTIGDWAFSNWNITSVEIPNSITTIGSGAFSNCSDLKSVISNIKEPFEINENVFHNDVFNSATLYVPKGAKEKYASKPFWNHFVNIDESEVESSVAVTIPSSGYATYCYQYPLDYSKEYDGFKAWFISGVTNNDDVINVTFERVNKAIQGGEAVILYGKAGNQEIDIADNGEILTGNQLIGVLEDTYIETVTGDYTNFGLKNGEFVKINNGYLKANRAYLPIATNLLPVANARFNFIFDDTTTGICELKNETFPMTDMLYNLNGQQLKNPTKSGLYIINGKKVVLK